MNKIQGPGYLKKWDTKSTVVFRHRHTDMKPLIDFLVANGISDAAFTICAADSAAAALAHKGGTAPTDKTDKEVSGNEKWGHKVSIFAT